MAWAESSRAGAYWITEVGGGDGGDGGGGANIAAGNLEKNAEYLDDCRVVISPVKTRTS